MKICTKCNKEKVFGEFYKDKRHLDGLGSLCKDCSRVINKIYKAKNPKKWKDYMREYGKTHTSPYKVQNPNCDKAIRSVALAIRKGTLTRLSCKRCSNKKTYAHHPFYGYSKPLEVMWLCAKHHKVVHAEERLKTEPIMLTAINEKNQQMRRVEESIDFYLTYHKIPEVTKMMIKGNLLQVFKKELKE